MPLRIEITLPRESKRRPLKQGEFYDRAGYGWLNIFDSDKLLLGPLACLGKGGGKKTAESWDWRKSNADTPTGEYIGTVLGPWNEAKDSYGPYRVIRLKGINGNALIAEENREGFAIHGGRDQSVLFSTYGCVRVFDRTMKQIIDVLDKYGVTKDIPVFVKEK